MKFFKLESGNILNISNIEFISLGRNYVWMISGDQFELNNEEMERLLKILEVV